jgi:hypothetical protein
LKLCFSDEFWEGFHQFTPHVQKQAKQAFEHLAQDPRYPSLQFKCVNRTEGKYSIRISHKYHALGYVQGSQVTWYWIGPHDEYEHRIRAE